MSSKKEGRDQRFCESGWEQLEAGNSAVEENKLDWDFFLGNYAQCSLDKISPNPLSRHPIFTTHDHLQE